MSTTPFNPLLNVFTALQYVGSICSQNSGYNAPYLREALSLIRTFVQTKGNELEGYKLELKSIKESYTVLEAENLALKLQLEAKATKKPKVEAKSDTES